MNVWGKYVQSRMNKVKKSGSVLAVDDIRPHRGNSIGEQACLNTLEDFARMVWGARKLIPVIRQNSKDIANLGDKY